MTTPATPPGPTRREELSIAAAAMHGAPWRGAASAGGLVTVGDIVVNILGPHRLLLASALSLGVTVFVVVAAVGAVFTQAGDRVTARARTWARLHPWRFALLPGLATAVAVWPVRLLLGPDGITGAALVALGRGLFVTLIVGLVTMLARSRRRSR